MNTEALVDLILDQTIEMRKRLKALEDRIAVIEKQLGRIAELKAFKDLKAKPGAKSKKS